MAMTASGEFAKIDAGREDHDAVAGLAGRIDGFLQGDCVDGFGVGLGAVIGGAKLGGPGGEGDGQ